ncbi:hypothetical protein NSB25_11335 [Acetatifactor muris]|uniref:Phage-related protein n=1 Tax=Acetatifactor muris TaxID=879566 RepID=A0A2K4ZGT2_9FIRM|nr:hypothetical protein [Acetatifactor muris]MCR2047877.1 hypothetical protein [Acetatifactor muris]SOY29680.1 hypothetical protein AMURIS_02401 [Acetatifactor muris]
MTIRDIAVAFGFEVDSQSEKKAENSIKGLKNLATKLLGVIGIGFSIAGLSNLAETAAEAEALKSQFSQVFGEMEDEAASKLEAIEADTGVLVNRMKGSFTQIAAFSKTAGVEQADALDIANRSMIAVADSAAFYDRSIEDVTNSLQSFLKGNFENDAALGLSCTETTRNTAANNLYGKSFKDLSEAEKQFTLLSMVEDANKASGALGQAARESDTWSNQLGNLKQSVNDLKAAAGNVFLKPAVQVLKLLSMMVQGATKWLQNMTSETGFLTRAFDRLHALVKRLQPAIDRMAQTLSRGVSKGIDLVKNIVAKFGGIENVLKIAAIAAGAFMAVLAVSKIMSFIKAAGGLAGIISKVAKAFSLANLKVMAIIAVIVILALIIEDFINFMQGNDSVIGTLFDKAGIGADNAREKILAAWTKIKEFLLNVWDFIKQAAGMWVDTVKGFFERHSESIRQNFERAWGIIKTFLQGVWTFISQLAATLFGSTEDNIDGSTQSTKDKLLEVWGAILEALSAVWDALYEVGSAIFNAIAAVIETVFGWIQTFWNNWGSEILSWFKVLWDSIGGVLNGFLEIVKGVANFISSVFTGDWQGAWDAIKQIFTGIWDAIVSFITAVWETIKLLFDMALGAIKAIWETVWGAISSFFQGIWNGICSFLSGIWSAITGTISNAINNAYSVIQSVLGAIRDFFSNIFNTIASTVSGIFSNILSGITSTIGNIKDTIVNGINSAVDFIKGLPGQAIQWGKDFIGGLKDGIMSGVQGIVDAVKGIGDKIRSFLHFSVPDEGPLTDYESWMPDFMSGLAEGISSNEETVLDKVRGLAEGISSLTRAATADVSTATASTVNNNSSSSVTQNVNIANSYTGGTPEVQKNVSKAMNKSASDATAYMARGLAYARG